ncbi:MAG: hypothetical protein AAGJ56_07175 [Myxococcota bacterium]
MFQRTAASRSPYADGMRALSVSLALVTGCSAANLWPADASSESYSEAEGRAWLDRAVEAQGGDALAGHQTISLWMRDRWPSWLFRIAAMPWPENGQLMRHDFVPGTDDVRMTYVGGPEDGTGWGVQQWVTYRFDANGLEFDPVDDPDFTLKFWLPTNAYFPLLAWRIREASYVRYLGTEQQDGRTLHAVFATWGDGPVPEDIDQYIVYIDDESHRVAFARYTVKEMGESFAGLMRYEDYRSVGNLTLPFSMMVVDALSDTEPSLHAYAVEKVEVDADLPAGWLVPRPDLRATK